jgi:methylated-DNA-protein-cysteine methyltransferase-like protein
MTDSLYGRIHAIVRRIPPGRVATYGQVAELAGLPGRARQVGYALHALPANSAVPWHRVLNARGMVSLPPGSRSALDQRLLLEREGVHFDQRGQVPLARFRWRPRQAPARHRPTSRGAR